MSDRHYWAFEPQRTMLAWRYKQMMYGSGEVLVWWAFVSGISFIALLVSAFVLVSYWAAPNAE